MVRQADLAVAQQLVMLEDLEHQVKVMPEGQGLVVLLLADLLRVAAVLAQRHQMYWVLLVQREEWV
jgi:hypothetical protein